MSDKKRCCCSAEDVIVPGDLWKDIVEFIKARDPARSTVTWFELENWRQAHPDRRGVGHRCERDTGRFTEGRKGR